MNNLYTIKRGDNLWNIARKLGTDVKTLIALNPQIKDPNKIYEGLHLAITERESPSQEAMPNEIYNALINNALLHIKQQSKPKLQPKNRSLNSKSAVLNKLVSPQLPTVEITVKKDTTKPKLQAKSLQVKTILKNTNKVLSNKKEDASFFLQLGEIFRNLTIGAAAAENPGVMTASGWRLSNNGWVLDKINDPAVEKLRNNLAIISSTLPMGLANKTKQVVQEGVLYGKRLIPTLMIASKRISPSYIKSAINPVVRIAERPLIVNTIGHEPFNTAELATAFNPFK